MTTLSVVMPHYNQGGWVEESLSALLAQTRPADEIIVVDDASTDDSLATIEAFTRKGPVRLIRHESNRGALAAINTGIGAARGTYLHCAGADDRVSPALFETAIGALEGAPQAAFFCARTALIDRAGKQFSTRPFTPPAERAEYISPREVRRRILGGDNWVVGASAVYRRSALDAIGGFDESLGALSDGIAGRLMAFRDGFWFDPQVLSSWRVYPESYSNSAAMSSARTLAQAARARDAIRETFPADVRDSYACLFERRYRFNAARLQLVWGGRTPDLEAIAAIAGFGSGDAAALKLASLLPMRRLAIQSYLAARLQPLPLTSMIAGARGLRRGRGQAPAA